MRFYAQYVRTCTYRISIYFNQTLCPLKQSFLELTLIENLRHGPKIELTNLIKVTSARYSNKELVVSS